MKKLIFVFSIFLMLSISCRTTPGFLKLCRILLPTLEPELKKPTDPVVSLYVEEFYTRAAYYNVPASRFAVSSISWMDERTKDVKGTSEVIGQCEVECRGGSAESGSGKIVIKKSWWDRASTLQQRELIFHELGHCVLLKDHVPVSQKLTVMNENIHGDLDLLRKWDEMEFDFFTAPGSQIFFDFGFNAYNKKDPDIKLQFGTTAK